MNRQILVVTGALLLGALACRDNTDSITEPSSTAPQPAVTTAAALSFGQLSAGDQVACGVTTDNRAYCWGDNARAQLGNGSYTDPYCIGYDGCDTHPVAVIGGLHFRNVSVGSSHTCGVTTDDRAYCWGYNWYGALGIGNTTGPERCHGGEEIETPCSTRPVAVLGGLRFRTVSVGGHTCGVTTDDRAYCWGPNTSGELGDGTTTQRVKPVAVTGGLRFSQVSAGVEYTCGLTTGNVAYCWGANGYGQLGDSTHVTRRLRPTRVAGGRYYRQIDAGLFHTCAVTQGYRAYCWGYGQYGQLGNGKTSTSFWPRAVSGGLSFRRVSAGDYHTCAESTTSRAYCWGKNYGQLGDGTTTQRVSPVAVTGGRFFAQVTAGHDATCGKTSAGVGYCWGNNRSGQLGDGTTETRLVPTAVVGPL